MSLNWKRAKFSGRKSLSGVYYKTQQFLRWSCYSGSFLLPKSGSAEPGLCTQYGESNLRSINEILTMFLQWETGCRVESNSSPTKLRKVMIDSGVVSRCFLHIQSFYSQEWERGHSRLCSLREKEVVSSFS